MSKNNHRWAPCSGLLIAFVVGCSEGDPRSAPDATGSGLTGFLKTESGEALANTEVLACMATTCLFGETDARGQFTFAVDPPAEIAFKTHPDLDQKPRRGAALHPVQIAEASMVDLGSVYVPYLPDGPALTPTPGEPQTLLAGDGLELTLIRSQLTPSLGEVLEDAAARLIPAARWPLLTELGGEQVVATYALHPFAAKSSSPIAVRVPTDLPRGTGVKFRTISEIDGKLSAAVGGKSDGAFLSTDPGLGITDLTWLVISK